MPLYERFDALIVNEDSANRGRLKQAALALTQFRTVFTCGALKEGLSRLCQSEPTDVVFLSFKFGWDRIREFIEEAQKTLHGAECAFVLILKANDQSGETVAQSVLGGVHGCLFEPYSADNLREIAEIAAKVKTENYLKRERAASQILVTEIIKHLDGFAFYEAAGKNTRLVLKKLAQSCQAVQKLEPESFAVYIQVAMEMLEKAKVTGASQYTGVSERVRKSVEAKIAKQLEAEYETV